MIFQEEFGLVTAEQLRLYRRFNVSPADHDDLVELFGDNPTAIVSAVKTFSTERGYFDTYRFWGAMGLPNTL